MEDVKMNRGGVLRDRLLGFVAAGDFAGLEGVWIEEISSAGEGQDPGPYLAAVDILVARGDRERARVLLDLLLPAVGDDPGRRVDVLRRLILIAPSRKDLRAEFIDCYRRVYPGSSFHETCLAVSGVETQGDTARALSVLDRVLSFEPGTTVFHEAGWGIGVVRSIDPNMRQAVVDLEGKRNHRIDLRVIADILKALPRDHFMTLQRTGGGELRAMAEGDPVRLFDVLLASFGSPLELKAIKARLVPDVVTAEAWSKWWSRSKGLLRESGFFRISDRSPFQIERMEKSTSYEDELLRQYGAESPSGRLGIARKHGKDSRFPKLRERIVGDLRAAAAGSGSPAVEAASVLERIGADLPDTSGSLERALLASPDPVEAILGVEGPEDRRRAIETSPKALGDSAPDAALTLLAKGDDATRDAAEKLLLASPAKDRAIVMVADALRNPRNAPDLFAWACKKYMEEDPSPIVGPFRAMPRPEVLTRILDLHDHVGLLAEREGKAAVRTTVNAARGLLAANGCRFFKEVTKPLDRAEARWIYGRVLSSGGLSEPLRVKLLEIIASEFPDVTRSEVRPIWEEEATYVTEEGLKRKRAEFRELTEVKLPKNFQDIGRAAAFGDLSENAEYTSALEERDRLTKRATELKANLDNVRIINPSLIRQGEIFLGSRIRLANPETGHEVSYRLLGPWDGGPEDGILSYRSPIAIGLLGKRVGDEVEIQLPGGTERFRVIEIGSAFDVPGGTGSAKGGTGAATPSASPPNP
jgi:transcription elongation factor GreA